MLSNEDFCFLNGERGALNKIIEKFNLKQNWGILLLKGERDDQEIWFEVDSCQCYSRSQLETGSVDKRGGGDTTE